jgi:hypothetical protein
MMGSFLESPGKEYFALHCLGKKYIALLLPGLYNLEPRANNRESYIRN